MKKGKYITQKGSTVQIYGKYGGKVKVEFDWFEEDNACCDCQVEPYPEDGFLIWHCDYCGGGRTKLIKLNN